MKMAGKVRRLCLETKDRQGRAASRAVLRRKGGIAADCAPTRISSFLLVHSFIDFASKRSVSPCVISNGRNGSILGRCQQAENMGKSVPCIYAFFRLLTPGGLRPTFR